MSLDDATMVRSLPIAAVHKLLVSCASDRNERVSSGMGPDCGGHRVNHTAQAGGGVVCTMGIACS